MSDRTRIVCARVLLVVMAADAVANVLMAMGLPVLRWQRIALIVAAAISLVNVGTLVRFLRREAA